MKKQNESDGVRPHLSEGALDKSVVAVRVPNELKYKVLQAFGNGGENTMSEAFLAACEFATRGVKLDKKSLDKVMEEQVAAYRKRLEARMKRDLPDGPSEK